MFPVEWPCIRSINNSRQEGFEELVCQLARYEPVPVGAVYQRKGKPDGGVECLWTFPDGSEWGWQAKFFDRSPDATQWGQIDKSVRRFLVTHPKMSKCTIALPLDLPDARQSDQKSAQQKWNDHVEKWQEWAGRQGQPVKFEYWGAHEILDRLSQEKHRGRLFFWFQREFFDQCWFSQRIEESIADAGARYTPELDVALPIAQLFDGLGRTDAFYTRLKGHVAHIRKDLPSGNRIKELSPKIDKALHELHRRVNPLCQTLSATDEESVALLDWQHIIHLIELAQTQTQTCEEIVARESKRIRADKKLQESSPQYQPKSDELVNYIRYDLRQLGDDLYEVQRFIESEEACLANTGALLLVGEAGKGKTHMFCDVARQRNAAQLPTILLLGEHFRGDIWQQILELLDLVGHSREDLLGALEAAAQVRGHKALILIDALNESTDLTMWHKRLRSFLQVIARYEWISVAISVRSSYEDIIIPDDVGEDQLVRIEHRGFEGVEYEATRHFFDHYGIEQPSVPLLNPEFQTPLFLKTLCKGLANEGLTRIPKGLHGITAIFDFFVTSICKRLQSPDKLNLSPHSNVVHPVIDRITTIMAERATHWLPIAEMEQLVNADLPPCGYTDSLFYHLLSEGLLAKDRFRAEDNVLIEGARFAYQRLADHLITQHLLDHYLADNPADVFAKDTPLQTLVQECDNWWQPQARGLIEALSIQLPERTGRELMALVPELMDNWFIYRAFVESLLWRDPQAISDETLNCINRCVKYEDLCEQFLDVLLTVAVDPVHPYNADFLHRRLMKDDAAERDAWWSLFLYEQYGQKRAVDRMVDWAWAENDKSRIEDESIRLCGMALAWFLTTSHRFLRDRATKALVNLLSNRLHVLRKLLQQFHTVNDLYVSERLLAVAYGCVMRSTNDEQIAALAQEIYDWLFSKGRPPAHILLRDYARGVIEYALHRGLTVAGNMNKIKPPYRSDWVDIPTEEEIKALEHPDGSWKSTDGSWAHGRIMWSVTDDDFAHYVIGEHLDWLSLRLDEPIWQTQEEVREQFLATLTDQQKNAWSIYQAACKKRQDYLIEAFASLTSEELEELLNQKSDDREIYERFPQLIDLDKEIAEFDRNIAKAEDLFLQTLSNDSQTIYKTTIRSFSEDTSPHTEAPRFSAAAVQRWIIKRVFDIGWSIERFGHFDHTIVGYDPRSGYKPERIGKKYQWLAYHEMLARLADNFQFREASYSTHKDRQQYVGTWQLHIRDIDPSCVLKGTWEPNNSTPVWWVPCIYNNWDNPLDDTAWVKSDRDLPDGRSLIDIVHPEDCSHWLNLHGFYKWEQPTPPDQDRYSVSRRDMFYLLQGYLVHKADIDEVFSWARQQDFFGRWMPEGRSLYHLYFGELYWSPAYQYHDDPYMGNFGWKTVPSRRGDGVSKAILPLSETYNVEAGTFDCSIDEGYSINVPIKLLFSGMGMHWSGSAGRFCDKNNQLVAFDPSTQQFGPGALLIHRNTLLRFLDQNEYEILWTLLGERRSIGGGFDPRDYPGLTVISGVYRLMDGEIIGGLSTSFRPPARSS